MKKYTLEEIIEGISILEYINENSEVLTELTHEQRVSLFKSAGTISRPDRAEIKKRQKDVKSFRQKQLVEENRLKRATTGIRSARENSVFVAPEFLQIESDKHYKEAPELSSPRNCYVCKVEFTKLHFFYDTMCKECGDYNYHKRFQRTDMTGQVAIITGSRLKIGYYATLMMLRSGATVVATTRFPVDSAIRYAKENDYHEWKDRLHVYGLDLRHTPSVELFCQYFENKFDRLDILINNAAQTVRRPPGFYTHLMDMEQLPYQDINEGARLLLKSHFELKDQLQIISREETNTEVHTDKAMPVSWKEQGLGMGITSSAELSQIPYSIDNQIVPEEVFPQGKLDADLQQVDLRTTNSWRLKLGEISTPEMLEVQLVNAVAPFVLCNRLVHVMRRENTGKKHIVNVTAMEGKFFRFHKEERHPHTNMAKAALNMLTHTSASDFAKDGIFMNAVDTGWVTDEDPAQIVGQKQQAHDFQPPLDIVDGAARICDPFIDGINSGKHWCGQFLKDYKPIDW